MSTPLAVHRPGGPPPAAPPRAGGGAAGLKNPRVLMAAGGAVLVVLLAVLRKGGGAAGTTTDPTGGTYDSTSNDLYNSIQPEIDALAKQLADLQNKQPGGTTTLPYPIKTAPNLPVTHPVYPGPPKAPASGPRLLAPLQAVRRP